MKRGGRRSEKVKKILKTTLIAFLAFITLATFAACKTEEDALLRSVSEYRSAVCSGEDDRYSVELVSGYRENPFEIDGKCGDKSDYTLITVTPKRNMTDKTLTVTLAADGKKTEGSALRHPYKDSYSFEFMSRTTCDNAEVAINDGNTTVTIALKKAGKEGEIGGYDALKTAVKELKESLSPYMSDGKFAGEIYVRYVNNPLGADGKYYWYVSFVPEAASDKTIAVLIDPESGKVAAARKQ